MPTPDGGPTTAPPPSVAGGVTTSGGAPSGGGPPATNGATPPLGGPAAGAVQPQGLVTQAQNKGSQVLKLMNEMLQAYHPTDEQWKDISESMKKLARHFPPPTAQIPTPRMATGNAASSLPIPPMAGGGNMSGGPLAAQAQRGPI